VRPDRAAPPRLLDSLVDLVRPHIGPSGMMGRMPAEIRDNPAESQYEIYVDGKRAGLMAYRLRGDTFDALHTEIDDAYEGQGLGSQLVKRVLQDLRDAGLSLQPTCPFVKAYLERHPEYSDLVKAS
jgi:predicted GNAT family acetyltransferase